MQATGFYKREPPDPTASNIRCSSTFPCVVGGVLSFYETNLILFVLEVYIDYYTANVNEKINHIAIIPDGNRRWAKNRGLPAFMGHKKGAEIAPSLIKYLWENGLHTITFWGLSTDNVLKRDKEELAILYEVIEKSIDEFLRETKEKNGRLIHLGRKDRMPKSLLDKLENAEKETKNNDKCVLNLALDYGGRDELLNAYKIANEQGAEITQENINQFLYTKEQEYPNPDLIIRTSGELRLSGFMPWQGALSEFYFEKKHFPDLTPEILSSILEEVRTRERRLGK